MVCSEEQLDAVALALSMPPPGSEAEKGNFMVGTLSADNEQQARAWARSLLLGAAQCGPDTVISNVCGSPQGQDASASGQVVGSGGGGGEGGVKVGVGKGEAARVRRGGSDGGQEEIGEDVVGMWRGGIEAEFVGLISLWAQAV